MNFNKIREYCEEKKITIAVLASQIGISEPGLYQVFRNKSMKVDVLEKIAEALNVPIWSFFDLDPVTPLNLEVEKLREKNEELDKALDAKQNVLNFHINKVEELERTLEMQNNIIQKQGEINEVKERLVEEKERSIKNYEEILTLYKKLAPSKERLKAKVKEGPLS